MVGKIQRFTATVTRCCVHKGTIFAFFAPTKTPGNYFSTVRRNVTSQRKSVHIHRIYIKVKCVLGLQRYKETFFVSKEILGSSNEVGQGYFSERHVGLFEIQNAILYFILKALTKI